MLFARRLPEDGLRMGDCRIKTWAEAKLLLARSGRSPAAAPNHQTAATEDLDSEPSCCLQDRQDAAAGRAGSVGGGCAGQTRAWRHDTASSNRAGWHATSVRYPGRSGDTRHREPTSDRGSGCGAAAGMVRRSRRPARDEIGRARTASDKDCKAAAGPSLQAHSSKSLGAVEAEIEPKDPDLRKLNWKKITATPAF